MPPPVQTYYKPIKPPKVGELGYQGFDPRKEVLPKGWKLNDDTMPLPCDMIAEHDVEIKMRDGVRIYADIYRPADSDSKPVPAIMMWSPYGKKYNGVISMSRLPFKLGVENSAISGLEKFEGVDPAFWVPEGYAIVNIDSRGAGDSEGYICIMGKQEGEDGHDAIEKIAALPWCSGSVGMAGNSHLAIVQWFIAAERPPSLKAIAPWEACSDLFREQFVRGGIFDNGLFDLIEDTVLRSRGGLENFREMYRRNPLSCPYWEDKRPAIENINIPAYITSSYSALVHTMGSIRGFRQLPTKDKWMRVEPYQEWYDLWMIKESSRDLLKFFDRYLKGIDNDWEKTPRVRYSLLQFGEHQEPLHYMDATDYPLPQTQYRKAYLHPQGRLDLTAPPSEAGSVAHDSESGQSFSGFTYTFDKDTQLAGLVKAQLYMSCAESDDMDVYVILRKLDRQGNEMLNLNLPWNVINKTSFDQFTPFEKSNLVVYLGPVGMLRASHRAIDESKTWDDLYPFHPHDREEKIPPGNVVKLDIGVWAMGIDYKAGESLRLQISGQRVRLHEFKNDTDKGANRGHHRVHFGPGCESHVVLPFI